jgi:outer membrane receptor protein involved in Fe transport
MATLAPGVARTAPASVHVFNIKPKSASEALIEFAVQANISIGGVNACKGPSHGLVGGFSVEAGLTRLLAKSGCGFRWVAADTMEVFVQNQPSLAVRRARPARQPLSAAADEPIDEAQIVVTATKRASTIGALPYAISALGHQQLEDAGALDIGDVAVQIASVSTTNLGLGRDKILLRGLSDGVFTGRTQSTVGIYLDDVPITYNAPDPDLQLADVDSIEVLRGPQGALYGGGTMSGIYRIVTRKPVLGTWSASFSGGGSLTEAGAPSDEFQGVINAPLLGDRVALRVVGYETTDGGYIDDTNLRLSNIDTTLREGARAAVRADLTDGWLVNLGLGYQKIAANGAQYVTPGAGRLHRANAILESSHNNFSQVVLNLEHATAWGDFKSSSSFVQHQFDSESDASTALPLFGANTAAVGSYGEPINIRMLVEDAVLTSPGNGRFQWLAGAFASATWEKTDSNVGAHAFAATPAQVLYLEHRNDQRDEAALYGDASYALTSRLTATAGLRIFTSNAQTQSLVQAPQIGQSRSYQANTVSSGVSPKIALAYNWARNDTVYVSASQGRRAGGVNTGGQIGTVFALASDSPGVHRRFGDDQLWNFETGLKAVAFDGLLSLNTAVFYDLWRNIQTDQFMPSGLSYTANAGDGRNIGWETELVLHPAAGFTLRGTALFNRPELIRADPGFIAGVNLPGVPDVSLGGRAAYRRPLFLGLFGLVSAEANYIGRSHLTFNPATSPSMGGYVLARLSAQIEGVSWRLAAFLSNPANTRGNTFSYGNPFNFQQAEEVTPERPLTLRMVLSKDF